VHFQLVQRQLNATNPMGNSKPTAAPATKSNSETVPMAEVLGVNGQKEEEEKTKQQEMHSLV